jgi:hypothetical protein
MTVRLTRRAHRHGGEVIVVVDKTTRQRLTHAGMDRWLNIAGTVQEARAMIDDEVVAMSA